MDESTWNEIVARMERWQGALELPSLGLVLVERRDGGEGFETRFHASGAAELSSGAPFDAETLFPIGSLSKTFTAVLAAMLVREGKLGWQDPVLRHLPDLRLSEPAVGMALEVQDLLAHRSGLSACDLLFASGDASAEEIIAQLRRAEIVDTAKNYLYSNINYFLAGEVLARASGKIWGELLDERILSPLGMRSTTASSETFHRTSDRARGYASPTGSGREPAPFQAMDRAAAAGGIFSNLRDLAPWLRFLLAPERGPVGGALGAADLRQLWTPRVPVSPGVRYGMGFKIGAHRGFEKVFHEGNLPGYSVALGLLPELGRGFVLLVGAEASPLQTRVHDDIWDLWLPETPEPSPFTNTFPGPAHEADLDEAPMHFRSADGATTCSVYRREERLCLDVPGQSPIRLEGPSQSGVYFSENDRSLGPTLVRQAEGEPVRGLVLLHLMSFNGLRLAEGERPADAADGATPTSPGQLPGRYHIQHIEKEVEVRLEGEAPVVDIPGDAVYRLSDPLGLGRWLIEPTQLQSLEFHGGGSRPARALTWRIVQPVEMARIDLEPPIAEAEALLELRRRTHGRLLEEGAVIERVGRVSYPYQGLEGELREWVAGSDRYRYEEDLGRFGSLLHLRLGERYWVRDGIHGRPLRELEGGEREAALAGLDFESAQAGAEAVAGAVESLRVLGREEIAGRSCLRVWVEPAVGGPATVWVDEDSGLILRRTSGLVTTVYEDFREFGGSRLPFRHRTEKAPPVPGRRILEIREARMLGEEPAGVFTAPA